MGSGIGIVLALCGAENAGSVLARSTAGRRCAEELLEWSKEPDFGVPIDIGVTGVLISCRTYSRGMTNELGRVDVWLLIPGGNNWSVWKNGNSLVVARVGDPMIGPVVNGPDER